jgi:aspartate carbamoyltransferase regulatory subunit
MKTNINHELVVQALKNGTVIDHIPSDKLFQVVSILTLDTMPNQITIGNNLESKKLGNKGIIKISDVFFTPKEVNKIALIAPNAKINIIKNYEVIKKVELVIPDEIKDTLQCINPMCITNKEHVPTHFYFIDKRKRLAKCHYCERICKDEDLMLK